MTISEFNKLYHWVRRNPQNGRYRIGTDDGGYTEIIFDMQEGRSYYYTYLEFGEEEIREYKLRVD